MKLKSAIVVLSICAVFIISQVAQVSAFSVRELLGLDKPEPEATKEISTNKKPTSEKNSTEWAKTSDANAGSNPQLDLDYFSLLLANMNQQERNKVLSDQHIFRQLVENEANNRATLSAAVSNSLEKDRNVEFLMRRGAENILREAYLNRLIATKLPADFPSSEQVTEYYETNKQQFVVPERVHVWQVFLKKSENASKKDIAALKEKADGIISQIKKGKSDFSSIALSESEHEQSKALGGYMGLLKTDELLPEMKKAILKLKLGELSKPVESEAGIHILKRDKIIASQNLELAQVEAQIRKLLINQANIQLRNAILSQARKEYPQDVSENKIEEWRLRLRTNTNQ